MNLALFDFDGTITRGDTYQPFLRYAVRWTRVAVGIVPMMPVAVAYQMGWLSARRARPIASGLMFIGASADAVRDLGRRYATEVLPRTIRPRALERIRWHQEHGDTVVVVSGRSTRIWRRGARASASSASAPSSRCAAAG